MVNPGPAHQQAPRIKVVVDLSAAIREANGQTMYELVELKQIAEMLLNHYHKRITLHEGKVVALAERLYQLANQHNQTILLSTSMRILEIV